MIGTLEVDADDTSNLVMVDDKPQYVHHGRVIAVPPYEQHCPIEALVEKIPCSADGLATAREALREDQILHRPSARDFANDRVLYDVAAAEGEAALILNVVSNARADVAPNESSHGGASRGDGGDGSGAGRAACLFGVTMGPRAPCELQDRPLLRHYCAFLSSAWSQRALYPPSMVVLLKSPFYFMGLR